MTLSKPSPKETLLLYIAASAITVNAALVEEKNAREQDETIPNLFRLRSPIWSKTKLFRARKERIHSGHGIVKAKALLPSTHHQSIIGTAMEASFQNSEAIGRIGKWVT
jgi:hypothetical protein